MEVVGRRPFVAGLCWVLPTACSAQRSSEAVEKETLPVQSLRSHSEEIMGPFQAIPLGARTLFPEERACEWSSVCPDGPRPGL